MNLQEAKSHGKSSLIKGIPIIILTTLLGAGLAYYLKKNDRIKYKSYSKIFPLEAEQDATAGLKEKFGLGGGKSGVSKYYNVGELVNSRRLSRTIVKMPGIRPAEPLYLALIRDHNLGAAPNKHIKVSTNEDANIAAASDILRNQTKITTEKTDFTGIECTAHNDSLALLMNELILKALSDFYITTKTAKARNDLNKIGNLRDSLKNAVEQVDQALLDFKMRTRYLSDSTQLLPRIRLERLRQELSEQYSSATMTYQNANFMLLSQSPIFQVLDQPTRPLTEIIPNLKKQIVIGAIVGLFIGLLLALRKVIARIIASELGSV